MKKTLGFFVLVFLMCFLFQAGPLIKTLNDNAVIAEAPGIASATPVGFTRNRIDGYAIKYIYRVGAIDYPISRWGSVARTKPKPLRRNPRWKSSTAP